MKKQIVRPFDQILKSLVTDPFSGAITVTAKPLNPLEKGAVEHTFRKWMLKKQPSKSVHISIESLRQGVKSALASNLNDNTQTFYTLRSAVHNRKLNETRGLKASGGAYVRA